ncbi:hypothetical protein BU26DRAFT_518666 [Trematosphaeria pertusa]|uniref:Uncharacterized protein n=1 Tax=Trematosphaeria pertusa TaxID=390896 RepID=A0A6A6IK45_9PLEO|nr:uncharacterized protein BU26DRAFT_518666 [Trematosphaeria pertusa]KAF2250252.1 hypothetical protein BU26DRAFT_518666 [Trematosphaeria pertusa]
METVEQVQPFRLMDLPAEIRDLIYQEMLCCFDPVEPPCTPGNCNAKNHLYCNSITPATHAIETTILRTCKQVHREAYDIMVKTNQFVNIQTQDIPLSQLLISSNLPVVTMDRAHTAQFQGYVMSVNMSAIPGGWVGDPLDSDDDMDADDWDPHARAPPAGTGPRFNFMILGRDWDAFCRMLTHVDAEMEGFSTSVKVVLTLNGYPAQLPDFKDPIEEFFTTKTQEALLRPLRKHIHGFQHVEVTGAVDPAVAERAVNEVKTPPWTNPRDILNEFSAMKSLGNQLYTEGNLDAASKCWMSAITRMRCMRCSATWASLAKAGGAAFASKLSELYFTIMLNHAQCLLEVMRSPRTPKPAIVEEGTLVMRDLREAMDGKHFFEHFGSTWVPSSALTAKLAYRQALCFRMMGQATDDKEAREAALDGALEWIMEAVAMAPGDGAIEREKREILDWERDMEREWEGDELYQEFLADVMGY